ncbi:MAG: autotransporter domain-containing protein [Geminicoccaceae bacterium]
MKRLDSITNEAGGIIRGMDTDPGPGRALELGTNAAGPTVVTNAGMLDGDVELGAHRLNLTGSSSRLIGDVTGIAGSIVDVQGTFASEGTFSVDTFGVSSGGSLSLGHDVTATTAFDNAGSVDIAGGMISITGDYTQSAGGNLALEVASMTSHGTLAVSGTADLSASGDLTVHVPDGGGTFVDGQTIADVINAGSINGTAVTVSDNSAILDFAGIVDGATVDLVVNANSLDTVLAGTDLSGVDPALASSLDTILGMPSASASSDIFGALFSLGTAADVASAMHEIDLDIGASAAQIQVMNVQAGSNQMIADRLAHLAGHRGGKTARAGIASLTRGEKNENLAGLAAFASFEGDRAVFDEFIPLSAAEDTGGRSVGSNAWVKLFGARTLQESSNDAAGFDARTGGVAVGVDGRLDDRFTLGVSLAYANSDVDGRSGSRSNIDIDSFQGSVYGIYDLDDATYVSGMIGGGTADNSAKRKITVGAVTDSATANYDSWNASAMFEAGHRMALAPGFMLTPRVHAEYIHSDIDGYREKGIGGAGLVVEGTNADSLDLGLSASMAYDPSSRFRIGGELGFTYDVLADDSDTTSRFIAGGTTFTTKGLEPGKFTGLAGLGLEFDLGDNMQAIAGYNLALREDLVNHQLAVNLRYLF